MEKLDQKSVGCGCFSICLFTSTILALLKIFNIIEISWLIVSIPLIIYFGVFLLFCLMLIFIVVIVLIVLLLITIKGKFNG